jgi:hypothetical protein
MGYTQMKDRQHPSSEPKVIVNRAPVLTLWASVVAERLGYTREEALSLGKAVAGLYAQLKGQHLGLLQSGSKPSEPSAPASEPPSITLLSRPIPITRTRQGVRAVSKGEPIDSGSVERYVKRAFGDSLPSVRQAMEGLAAAYEPNELARMAYNLYEQFRPQVVNGIRGWGAKGELDLELLRSLASP